MDNKVKSKAVTNTGHGISDGNLRYYFREDYRKQKLENRFLVHPAVEEYFCHRATMNSHVFISDCTT